VPHWASKTTAAAADSASVNFGSENGAMAQLKEAAPMLIEMKCAPHRLELAVKDTEKDVPYLTDVNDVRV
jgi:hypothetical protein